ncbi:MAG TPA: VOC family protein [Gemmatimonadales bacterium]|nr:VOC family protein [Gemmatimonadales bacterium]
MTVTLHSVAVFVTDIERAKRFYRDDLGLPLQREGSFGAEFLEGPTHLGVHPAVHPDARAMVGRPTGLTLHVDGILDYCERLHLRGVRFLNEPTRQSFGVMALIADPDGNILALWDDQFPEDDP